MQQLNTRHTSAPVTLPCDFSGLVIRSSFSCTAHLFGPHLSMRDTICRRRLFGLITNSGECCLDGQVAPCALSLNIYPSCCRQFSTSSPLLLHLVSFPLRHPRSYHVLQHRAVGQSQGCPAILPEWYTSALLEGCGALHRRHIGHGCE